MLKPKEPKFKAGDLLKCRNAVILITRTGLSIGGEVLYFYLEDGIEHFMSAWQVDRTFRLVA
jgi:hypothetical protein